MMEKEPVQILIKLVAARGQGKQMLAMIRPLLGSIRSRAGCRDCDVYLENDAEDKVALFEEWEDEASFTDHVCSRDFGYILEWMEQSIEQPEVKVGAITQSNALEYISNIRMQRCRV